MKYTKSFIETQFPVSKLSKEAYKERKAGASQTLTGLGKWWGRKPLVLVRAALVGLLMPDSGNHKKDMDIFLKIMTMDENGLESRIKPDKTDEFYEAETYDEKLKCCYRPEEIEGPDSQAWNEINAHLGTSAGTLAELIRELGERLYGERPQVGDAFCGGGSIPFEAARIGCDAFASDLNPAACMLTWAALNIIGGGPELQEEIEKAQQEVFEAADKQITEWGIEHNEKGWRADAFLYCIEAESPATGRRVPLAPSWIISEKYNVCALPEPNNDGTGYRLRIVEGATKEQMKQAKKGTIQSNAMVCPDSGNSYSVSSLRGDRRENGKNIFGLRMWENDDLVPRADDVFTERLYCIRYIQYGYRAQGATGCTIRFGGSDKVKLKKNDFIDRADAEKALNFSELIEANKLKPAFIRHFREPDADDLKREQKVLDLLREKFSEWQSKGFIPARLIPKDGQKTIEPIRNRGWTHWQHLFNPRQLLLGGLMISLSKNRSLIDSVSIILTVMKMADRNSKLSIWDSHKSKGPGNTANTFYNQAYNTQFNYGSRGILNCQNLLKLDYPPIDNFKFKHCTQTLDARSKDLSNCHIWITDPPYADAVNYHELGDFFLAWYEKQLKSLFPEWYTDSKSTLAIKGTGQSFNKAMVSCYLNLTSKMPDNGAQLVMFTHQDAAVWADLAMILWAAGLQVTAAWTIQTETDSVGIKKGNYVKGTVCMVLRKRIGGGTAFPSDLQDDIDFQVEQSIAEMTALDDKEDPNFESTDYQLAAYVAALRVITSYERIEGIDLEYELNRERSNKTINPLEALIDKAVTTACNYLIPLGMVKETWNKLTNPERFYCKTLEMQAQGERRNGPYQELARGFGLAGYTAYFSTAKANEVVLHTAIDMGDKFLDEWQLGNTLLRNVLYAIRQTHLSETADTGYAELKNRIPDLWAKKEIIIKLLTYICYHGQTMEHWKDDVYAAALLSARLQNEHV
ncbi:MAG: DUF1156 domain-containing protein [Candidatus Cyclonatronum sp.]|uniref:anti-phage-associated DUF1156 domain-containing protein n=1 Tax=Cyclonatronum sp. TaxID=3024185 RepID=UPI0025BBF12C|nr:anti-phage-associated DUF1156 domain-containing protein [Cyclonatronum sp.]MCH8487761.1 DUF1156 domain-containing protein [Cyclonatronum sp.]